MTVPGSRVSRNTSALALSEDTYHRFAEVELVQPFEPSLKEKRQRMNAALDAFGALVDYEVGEVTAAATFYMAEIYSDLSRALIESERPADLGPAELQEYEAALDEEAFPFEEQAISPGAAPEWIDRLSTSGASVLVVVQPAGWVAEWHENPKPQWIVPLSGRWFVETMDGTRIEMGPGEASFGNDQRSAPDAQGRRVHRSGTVGPDAAVLMLVQLEIDAAPGAPCRFK